MSGLFPFESKQLRISQIVRREALGLVSGERDGVFDAPIVAVIGNGQGLLERSNYFSVHLLL